MRMDTFLNIDPSNLTIYVFLSLITFSFLLMFLLGDSEEKTYQKIIGGLSIFIVSLIAKHVLIFVIALFIGGLIIASEKFLKSLAAILKTDSGTMPQTLAALSEGELTHASSEEIDEEKKKEITDIATSPQTEPESDRLSFADIVMIEKKIIDKISDKYGNCFTPNLKLENKYGQIVVDGVIHHSTDLGRLNIDNALTLVETKYISKPANERVFEMITKRVLERIRFLLITKQVLIVFYAKGLTHDMSNIIKARLESLFTDGSVNDVVFGFINLDEELNPEILVLNDLQSHVTR